jgi:DNA mismatch endonuclease (patch repair protein)
MLPGRPDLVVRRFRIAVFCDGDFWHGRNWSNRKRKLATGWNARYWVAKIQRNRERDRRTTALLRRLGWHVVRVWESEVRRNPNRAAAKILEAIKSAAETEDR